MLASSAVTVTVWTFVGSGGGSATTFVAVVAPLLLPSS
jgi:hypothetical protein